MDVFEWSLFSLCPCRKFFFCFSFLPLNSSSFSLCPHAHLSSGGGEIVWHFSFYIISVFWVGWCVCGGNAGSMNDVTENYCKRWKFIAENIFFDNLTAFGIIISILNISRDDHYFLEGAFSKNVLGNFLGKF